MTPAEIAAFFQASGPWGVAAVSAWAFWRLVNELGALAKSNTVVMTELRTAVQSLEKAVERHLAADRRDGPYRDRIPTLPGGE